MERFERFQMDVHLPLIVGSATPVDISVAHFGLKGWRGPEFQRFRGLDVIVTVEQHGRLAGSFERFRVNEWMKAGWDDFDGLETGVPEAIGNPLGGALDVGLVLALCADRRDAEKFVKLLKVLLTATFYKFSKVHMRPPGAIRMSKNCSLTAQILMKKNVVAACS
jgi:hypothetical protein